GQRGLRGTAKARFPGRRSFVEAAGTGWAVQGAGSDQAGRDSPARTDDRAARQRGLRRRPVDRTAARMRHRAIVTTCIEDGDTSRMTDEIKATICAFVIENFLFGDDSHPLPSDLSLIDNGLIDSTGVLELVGF